MHYSPQSIAFFITSPGILLVYYYTNVAVKIIIIGTSGLSQIWTISDGLMGSNAAEEIAVRRDVGSFIIE